METTVATESPEAVPEPLSPPDPDHRAVMRRIRSFAIAGYAIFAIYTALSADLWAFVGLTCSALVAIINFLWLEEIVVKLLQPAPRVSAWRMGLRTLARFLVFGVALTVAIFIARFNALSVLLGFSIIVVGIFGEALYSTFKSFTPSE